MARELRRILYVEDEPDIYELLLAMFEEAIEQGAKPFIVESAGLPPVERLHRLLTAPLLLTYDERAQRINRWRSRERQRLVEVFPHELPGNHAGGRKAQAGDLEIAQFFD